jgi:Zn finger protein HypA/HybF involved in hydrogenase expression
MHEVSLVSALFDQTDRAVAPQYAPSAVRRIRLRLGDASGVEPELIATAFTGLRDERGYDKAELELVKVTGRELTLERIDLEVPDV